MTRWYRNYDYSLLSVQVNHGAAYTGSAYTGLSALRGTDDGWVSLAGNITSVRIADTTAQAPGLVLLPEPSTCTVTTTDIDWLAVARADSGTDTEIRVQYDGVTLFRGRIDEISESSDLRDHEGIQQPVTSATVVARGADQFVGTFDASEAAGGLSVSTGLSMGGLNPFTDGLWVGPAGEITREHMLDGLWESGDAVETLTLMTWIAGAAAGYPFRDPDTGEYGFRDYGYQRDGSQPVMQLDDDWSAMVAGDDPKWWPNRVAVTDRQDLVEAYETFVGRFLREETVETAAWTTTGDVFLDNWHRRLSIFDCPLHRSVTRGPLTASVPFSAVVELAEVPFRAEITSVSEGWSALPVLVAGQSHSITPASWLITYEFAPDHVRTRESDLVPQRIVDLTHVATDSGFLTVDVSWTLPGDDNGRVTAIELYVGHGEEGQGFMPPRITGGVSPAIQMWSVDPDATSTTIELDNTLWFAPEVIAITAYRRTENVYRLSTPSNTIFTSIS